MSPFAQNFNVVVSLFGILAQVVTLLLLASLIFKKDWYVNRVAKRYSIILAFLTALFGTVFSLVYSDVIGFAPCTLCYVQRFFLYPQVAVLGVLLFRESILARKIALGLSSIGGGIALYHYYGQMFNVGALACDIGADGISVCGQIPFIEFGYMTIPMLSLTSFILVIALLLPKRK
ncbi:MAG: disulfide bond formation protein B [Candidatus Pacebacteria bacterium]|jgi:disulfide bond formation protein DsbB|nr:disulfide bond formation protein B [Candidatus Paceibacterota bacterium]